MTICGLKMKFLFSSRLLNGSCLHWIRVVATSHWKFSGTYIMAIILFCCYVLKGMIGTIPGLFAKRNSNQRLIIHSRNNCWQLHISPQIHSNVTFIGPYGYCNARPRILLSITMAWWWLSEMVAAPELIIGCCKLEL